MCDSGCDLLLCHTYEFVKQVAVFEGNKWCKIYRKGIKTGKTWKPGY